MNPSADPSGHDDDALATHGPRAFLRDVTRFANLLCLYRIVGIAAAISIYWAGHPYPALALGTTAGLTDYVDGWWARRTGTVTQLGALLDQVADLLFAFLCILTAVLDGVWQPYILVLWAIRDITILAVRASAAQMGFQIPSVILGKAASNFYFYSFVFMVPALASRGMAEPPWFALPSYWVCMFAIHTGLVLQYISGVIYIRRYIASYRS